MRREDGGTEASPATIPPDVAIDGLVADGELADATQVAGDLLGAPLLSQQRVDPGEVAGRKSRVASGSRPSAAGALDGDAGAIPAVATRVAAQLATDRTAVTTQLACDLADRAALFPKRRDHVSFARGDLVVRHGVSPCLGGFEETPVSRVTSLGCQGVALTL